MRKLTLSIVAASFAVATAAAAAPLPAGIGGIGQMTSGDLVQVKAKKKRMKKSKKMMNQGDMGGQPMGGGGGMSGQPMQGGSAGAGQPGSAPQKTQ